MGAFVTLNSSAFALNNIKSVEIRKRQSRARCCASERSLIYFIHQEHIMAVTIKNGKYNREQLELEIKMLKALVMDLERIFQGDYPDERTLANSPAITSWKLSKRRQHVSKAYYSNILILVTSCRMASRPSCGYSISTEIMPALSAAFIALAKKTLANEPE